MAYSIIDDSNYHLLRDDPLTRKLCGTLPRQALVGSLPFASVVSDADFPLIDPATYSDRIADLTRARARLSDFVKSEGIRAFHQGSTSYCHGNACVMPAMINEAIEGKPKVILSPASVAGPVTNFQNRGAMIESNLAHISRYGAATTDFVPPNQIGRDGFKPGWKENALEHVAGEYFDLGYGKTTRMFHRCATLLLSGIAVTVAYNWWTHAVVLLDLVEVSRGVFGFLILNSWGVDWPKPGDGGFAVLTGQKSIPDAAYALRTSINRRFPALSRLLAV